MKSQSSTTSAAWAPSLKAHPSAIPPIAWRAVFRRREPLLVVRVDPRADRTVTLIQKLSHAIRSAEGGPKISNPAVGRLLEELSLEDGSLAYKLLASAHAPSHRTATDQAPSSRRKSRPKPPPFRQIVGGQLYDLGKKRWGYGLGPQSTPIPILSAGRKLLCEMLGAEAQADADTITQDVKDAKKWFDAATSDYKSAQAALHNGNYLQSLELIVESRTFLDAAQNAADECFSALNDLIVIMSSLGGPNGCARAPFDKLWNSVHQLDLTMVEGWALGVDDHGNPVLTSADQLKNQLNLLEGQVKDEVNKTEQMAAAQSVLQCWRFDTQWYGGDFVLDETCTLAFLKWMADNPNSNWSSILQSAGGVALGLIPAAGPFLSIVAAILQIDENVVPLAVQKEDKGKGVTIHVSGVPGSPGSGDVLGGTTSFVPGGTLSVLLLEATTGAGEFPLEALATAMWITGN